MIKQEKSRSQEKDLVGKTERAEEDDALLDQIRTRVMKFSKSLMETVKVDPEDSIRTRSGV